MIVLRPTNSAQAHAIDEYFDVKELILWKFIERPAVVVLAGT